MTENNSISLFKTLGLKIEQQHKPVLESEKKFYLIQVQSLEILHPNFMKTQSRETDLQTEDKNSKPSSSTNPKNTKQIWEGKITFQIGCRQSFTQLQIYELNMIQAQDIEKKHFDKLNLNNKDQKNKRKANSKDKNQSKNKNVSKDKTSLKDKTSQKDKTQNKKKIQENNNQKKSGKIIPEESQADDIIHNKNKKANESKQKQKNTTTVQSKGTGEKKKTEESKITEEEKRTEESKTVEEKKTIEDGAGKKIEENTAKEEKQQQKKKDKKLNKKFDHRFNTALNYKHKQDFKDHFHLFPFEKEQVMAIRLEVVQNVKDERKEYAREYGYALIPIVPFIKLPYMKHQLEVHMVSQNDKKQIKNINIAKLNISLHFMHNFKARVFVEVQKADLERNLAKIGQMHPIIHLFLRNFKYNTAVIDEGGIKPHWKSQKKGQFCYFNIPLDSVRDDLFVSLLWRNEILKDIIDDITATDYIVGQKKVDFQVQTIFKTGTNLEEFIKKAIENAETKMKDRKKEIQNQIKDNKLSKKQNEREKEAGQQVKNQKEKFDKTTKDGTLKLKREDLLEKLKAKRFDLYREKLKQFQGIFIEELIREVPTIDTSNWPEEFMQSYETKMLEHFQARYEQFKTQQQQKYYNMNEFKESTQEVKKKYREEYNQELKKIDATEQIKKVLREVIRQVGISIDDKMKSIAIGLNYENMQAKNQAEKEKSAGVLYIRTFFLYEFQYPIVQKKTYPEEDTFF